MYDINSIFSHHWNNLYCSTHQQILLPSDGTFVSYSSCKQRIGLDMKDSQKNELPKQEAA
jgi:hypothetical protein